MAVHWTSTQIVTTMCMKKYGCTAHTTMYLHKYGLTALYDHTSSPAYYQHAHTDTRYSSLCISTSMTSHHDISAPVWPLTTMYLYVSSYCCMIAGPGRNIP